MRSTYRRLQGAQSQSGRRSQARRWAGAVRPSRRPRSSRSRSRDGLVRRRLRTWRSRSWARSRSSLRGRKRAIACEAPATRGHSRVTFALQTEPFVIRRIKTGAVVRQRRFPKCVQGVQPDQEWAREDRMSSPRAPGGLALSSWTPLRCSLSISRLPPSISFSKPPARSASIACAPRSCSPTSHSTLFRVGCTGEAAATIAYARSFSSEALGGEAGIGRASAASVCNDCFPLRSGGVARSSRGGRDRIPICAEGRGDVKASAEDRTPPRRLLSRSPSG